MSGKLDELPATLDLLGSYDASDLAEAMSKGSGRHVLSIGSGGSLVAAEFMARCRDTLDLGPTTVSTPMQCVLDHHRLEASDVWLFSAGGDNPDVCAAAQAAVDRGGGSLNLVTRNPTGAATVIVENAGGVVHLVPVADMRDGYLATHSLISMLTALVFASNIAARVAEPQSKALRDIVARMTAARAPGNRQRLAEHWRHLRREDVLIIAADPSLRPVATLLDTSLWEAALCAVQTTDFRNLSHGRHAWLHHRTSQSVVLAMTTVSSQPIWRALEGVLPREVRAERLALGGGGRMDNLLGIVDGLMLIEAFGQALAVDPGKPGIAEFGRTMYDDRSLRTVADQLSEPVRHKRAAIVRTDGTLPDEATLTLIGRQRLRRIETGVIGGIVLDYDGTVISTDRRRELPDQPIVDELVRLHRLGVKLGIATGRGGSAGEDLRSVLPSDVPADILIGYYNGGYLRTADVDIDRQRPARNDAILAAVSWLKSRNDLFVDLAFKARALQIVVDMADLRRPYRFAMDARECPQVANGELKIVASGHSFDIIPATSCKSHVVEAVRRATRPGTQTLCFGDSGATHGNDFSLLSSPHGISVGEVCDAANGCWSLFGGAMAGPEALLRTLRALVSGPNGAVRLDSGLLQLDKRFAD